VDWIVLKGKGREERIPRGQHANNPGVHVYVASVNGGKSALMDHWRGGGINTFHGEVVDPIPSESPSRD